jgi:Cu/Ag efflux protein CusF
MKTFVIAIALSFLAAAMPALAQGPASQATTAANGIGSAEGEVRRVDKDAKKLVIKHGDFKGIDMPGMTMAFPVKDPKLVDNVKPGDRIRFFVEQSGGDLVIVKIEKAK